MSNFPNVTVFAFAAALASVATAQASDPVGGKYFTKTIGAESDITIFTGSQNANGITLGTVVINCYQNADLFAVTPKNKKELIAFCADQSGGAYGVSQLQGVLLPPGWGLEFSSGNKNENPEESDINMTYDFSK